MNSYQEIIRGDIFYIDPHGVQVGSEQHAGRPAIVVSNDANNRKSGTVEVVYLTTAPKINLPTHVTIWSTGVKSTALCEQVTTVSTSRVGQYIGHCTPEEIALLNQAVMCSLGLQQQSAPDRPADSDKSAVAVERDLYKTLYYDLMNRVAPIVQHTDAVRA